MKIYTKTGDQGTSIYNIVEGSKSKSDIVFEVLGTLDEANASIAIAKLNINNIFVGLTMNINMIQAQLIMLSSYVASGNELEFEKKHVIFLENAIDEYDIENLDYFRTFGEFKSSTYINNARVTVRRAERSLSKLGETRKLGYVQAYINRLSDYLFVLSLEEWEV